MQLEITLAVIASVLGAVAIMGLAIFALYACRHQPRKQRKTAPARKKTRTTTSMALGVVEQNETSSTGSVTESGPAGIVSLGRNAGETTSHDISRRSASDAMSVYSEDFNDVWSYAVVC